MEIKRIVFYGTPEFAVNSLQVLYEAGYEIAAVVTVPDKKSGRGLKITKSPVKIYAENHNLIVLQPDCLNAPTFVEIIKDIKPDLQIVVAFRKLPDAVFNIPIFGTINLHASLLPDYRGAAPINWAIINGEKYSGITTFFINDRIDTGNIILQKKIDIMPFYNAGILHDVLMKQGAKLLLDSLNEIMKADFKPINQETLLINATGLRKAPKILKEDCQIHWTDKAFNIVNKIKGLAPFPCAYTYIVDENNEYYMKIYDAILIDKKTDLNIGYIDTDGKTYLNVVSERGLVGLQEVQLMGKTKMPISTFLKGFRIKSNIYVK